MAEIKNLGVTQERLREMLKAGVKRFRPNLVEVRYKHSGESQILPVDVNRIVQEIAAKVQNVVIGKIDTTYLVRNHFEYAMTVDVED